MQILKLHNRRDMWLYILFLGRFGYFCVKVEQLERIIICVTNDLSADQRVHKTALTLKNRLGKDVWVIGRKRKNSPEITRPYTTRRFSLPVNKGPLFYAFYNFRLLLFLLNHRYTEILSNDLDTLPAARVAAGLKRVKLFYDSHELYTEVPELINRPRVQNIWSWLERRCVKRVDRFYTVCKPIAEIYEKQYNKKVEVIRNVPLYRPKHETEKYDKPTLIYQGALNIGRGIELMIETMELLPRFQLIICGRGDVEDELQHKASKQKSKNIHFKGHVDFEMMQTITSKAHIGLSWEENMGLNYYYALPNKIFDYIQARIPVLVADLPGMKSIVEQYGVGEVLEERQPEKIARQIVRIFEKRHTFGTALENAAGELNWNKEEQKLIDIFI